MRKLNEEEKEVAIEVLHEFAGEESRLVKEFIAKHNLKPIEIEVGKVYKGDTIIFMCTRLDERGYVFGYGFGNQGNWHVDDDVPWGIESVTEASKEEWLKRLSEYAIKRGYIKGVKVISTYDSTPSKINGTFFSNSLNSFCAHLLNDRIIGSEIMKDGVWSEIIKEEPLELTMEDIANKFGVDVATIKIKK